MRDKEDASFHEIEDLGEVAPDDLPYDSITVTDTKVVAATLSPCEYMQLTAFDNILHDIIDDDDNGSIATFLPSFYSNLQQQYHDIRYSQITCINHIFL